jgi:hypothetical protein
MRKNVILILIGAVLTLGVVLAFWLWLSEKSSYKFGEDRAAVINQVQSLSKLETASFSIDKIIEAGTDYGNIKQFLFGDKLLLVAHGKVVAGFDMSTMKPEDFAGTGTSITLNLPAPKIFDVILDNSQTRVFDRTQGIFTKGDIALESQARQEAEKSIRQAACDGNILDEATTNAKKQLETIFKSAGFNSVTINTQIGKCE